jgi:hypothetical protein
MELKIAVAAATIGVIYGYDLGNISGAVGLYFLSALEALGGTATFAVFAALAAIAFVFAWWLAPETKGRPLEAIRAYWENGGRWPDETPAPPARREREGSVTS